MFWKRTLIPIFLSKILLSKTYEPPFRHTFLRAAGAALFLHGTEFVYVG